ncbi:MAG: N-acetyl-gamma-glutamyl-phosphate reductase [Bacteroidaceae bacterium]|nr:N-acetyl-gamma-glutamyl-phosphate reductase [Bacteroidaceae bacterium]
MIKVGIIGGAGYTAGELIRILLHHPGAEIVFVHSTSNAGNPLTDVHGGLLGETDLKFSAEMDLNAVDVLFMCSGHGKSTEFWQQHKAPAHLKIVDLAQDFRDESCGYVYGLPEWKRPIIEKAQYVANPGCFATAIQLALLPLAHSGKLRGDVQVTAITGSTGAGVKPSATTHFSWRTDNLSVYKAFEHQHLLEINRTIQCLQPTFEHEINFVPMRGDFARGILAAVYTETELGEDEARQLYKEFYADAAFTFVSEKNVDLKQVVNTNKALLHVEKHGRQLLIVSVIDNLLKGASGQAVQNMNLICGLDEKMGLLLKPSAF